MKTLLKSVPLALLVTFVAACGSGIPSLSETEADVSSPATYTKKGLEFQYPGNWTEGEELDLLGVQQASVESSGSALVFVHKFPAIAADDLATYAKDFSDHMQQNVPIGKMSPFTKSPIRKMGDFEYIKLDYSITAMGETVPHECTMYRKTVGSAVIFLITQAASEDLANAQPGFDLVRKTLKYKGQ